MSTNTYIFQDESKFHRDKFNDGFLGSVKLFIENGLSIKTIKYCFDEAMVNYCINNNPRPSNKEIAFKTGLDRKNGTNSPEQVLIGFIDDGYVKRKDYQINVLEWGRVKEVNSAQILQQVSNLLRRIVNVKFANRSREIKN